MVLTASGLLRTEQVVVTSVVNSVVLTSLCLTWKSFDPNQRFYWRWSQVLLVSHLSIRSAVLSWSYQFAEKPKSNKSWCRNRWWHKKVIERIRTKYHGRSILRSSTCRYSCLSSTWGPRLACPPNAQPKAWSVVFCKKKTNFLRQKLVDPYFRLGNRLSHRKANSLCGGRLSFSSPGARKGFEIDISDENIFC